MPQVTISTNTWEYDSNSNPYYLVAIHNAAREHKMFATCHAIEKIYDSKPPCDKRIMDLRGFARVSVEMFERVK